MLKSMDSVIIVLFIIVALIWLGIITKYLLSNKSVQKNTITKEEKKGLKFTPELEETLKKYAPKKSLLLQFDSIDNFKFPIGILLGILIAELPLIGSAFIVGIIVGYYILKFFKNY